MVSQESQDPFAELFAVHGRVEELDLGIDFTEHMVSGRRLYRKHIVSAVEILEAFGGAPLFFSNSASERTAPIVMVGKTLVGRYVTVPLVPTSSRGLWRPLTAFESNRHHRERYIREGGNGEETSSQ